MHKNIVYILTISILTTTIGSTSPIKATEHLFQTDSDKLHFGLGVVVGGVITGGLTYLILRNKPISQITEKKKDGITYQQKQVLGQLCQSDDISKTQGEPHTPNDEGTCAVREIASSSPLKVFLNQDSREGLSLYQLKIRDSINKITVTDEIWEILRTDDNCAKALSRAISAITEDAEIKIIEESKTKNTFRLLINGKRAKKVISWN